MTSNGNENVTWTVIHETRDCPNEIAICCSYGIDCGYDAEIRCDCETEKNDDWTLVTHFDYDFSTVTLIGCRNGQNVHSVCWPRFCVPILQTGTLNETFVLRPRQVLVSAICSLSRSA